MIVVERATEEDIAYVCAIDEAHMGSRERCEWLAEKVQARQCLIARQGEERMGYAIVDRSFFDQRFISLLLVHPDFRRRGVATALMRYAEKTCPAEKLFTSTNQSNKPMQALCEKLGYVRCGYVEHLDEGDPEIIYIKFLKGH